MKRILSFLIPVFSSITTFCQLEAGLNYNMAIPQKELAENINLTHSAVIDLAYRFKKIPRLRSGIQLSWGNYAQKKEDQHYEFRDGSSTDVEVTFSSNVFNSHVVAGYDLSNNKDIIPYISGKMGLSKYYTKIYIPDPDDVGSCRPLKNKNMFHDVTWSVGGSAGARMNINRIIRNYNSDNVWLDLSVGYLTGGDLDYLNVKNMQHHEENEQNVKEYNLRFVNISTNELHDHHVAQVFNSRINLIDVKLGFIFRFK